MHFWLKEKFIFLQIMKTKKIKKTIKNSLSKGFTIDTGINNKYSDQLLFRQKVEQANHILKTVGLPKI